VMIEHVHATGAILTSSITGIPGHEVQDVTLSGIHIETEEAGKAEWMSKPVPEQSKSYPEARMFGRLPSYGLYCRHVNGLTLENLAIAATRPDERPALHFEDVKNLRLDRPELTPPSGGQPLVRLVDVHSAAISGCSDVSKNGQSTDIRIEGK
jgi:hypothetical protein